MGLRVTPLCDALGAEINGTDLRIAQDAGTAQALRSALLEHLVLAVRDQHLSTDEQVRFARLFGELEEVRTKKDDPARTQYVLFVSNRPVEGSPGVLPEGPLLYHSDQCYYERPCSITMLHAIELPGPGGETLFVNMYRAWETLPGDLREALAKRRALNLFDYDADGSRRDRPVRLDAPQFAHPAVIRHPETGRRALYVNPQMTQRLSGMDPAESEALLQRVFAHMDSPRLRYEHAWRPGDLLLWDNRCTVHGRRDFDPAQARILRRVTVRGTRPVAAYP